MTAMKKQKPNLAVRLDDGLEAYLRAKAGEAHRTLSGEVRLRLEQSRALDQQQSPSTSLPPKTQAAKGEAEMRLDPHSGFYDPKPL